MVVDLELSDAAVDRLFRALADATRRDIVRRTLAGGASVSEFATAYDMSWAAVQKHVAILEGAELVTKEARGRERIVRGIPSRSSAPRLCWIRTNRSGGGGYRDSLPSLTKKTTDHHYPQGDECDYHNAHSRAR
ncbi:metalloregulator ArsR/SmtB family transcription factor [Arthrobacter sp. ISL-48]|uniref:ArsR/SmtB family transcription factor n=1 Tax=Arthrobacter sp. ISL-48 TaxID=2819110 RepID=UPI00288939AE|nr:metalloregulator ArsR/SmtB family transcription factor [Arthrobacter sp. ISL-48]